MLEDPHSLKGQLESRMKMERRKAFDESNSIDAFDFYEKGFWKCFELLYGAPRHFHCSECGKQSYPDYGRCAYCGRASYDT